MSASVFTRLIGSRQSLYLADFNHESERSKHHYITDKNAQISSTLALARSIGGVLFAAFSIPAKAAVVFDNGGPDTNNGYWIDGSNSTADNFSVASNASIGSVGFYFQNYNGIAGWNQDITYEFLTDNGGSPNTLLASGAGQNLVAVDSGQPWCCGGNAYLVTFDLVNPFLASAGTPYWLRLSGATGAPSAWWVTSPGSGSSLPGLIRGDRNSHFS